MMRRIAMMLSVSLLAGCASMQRIDDAESRVAESTEGATAVLKQMAAGTDRTAYLQMQESAQYVAAKPVVKPVAPVPDCAITFAPTAPMTLLQFGQHVSKSCHFPVRVTPDAISAVERGVPGGDTGPALPLAPPSGASVFGMDDGGARMVDIRFQGQVRDLISAVTTRLGLSWRYKDGLLSIYFLDTRTYQIYSIPTRNRSESVVTSGTTTSAGVSSGSGGSSSGGGAGSGGVSGQSGSTQTTTVSLDHSASEDLPKAIASILTPQIGRFFLAPSTQTLTVTDTPEVLDQVGDYVDALNEFSTKSVLLNVRVVNVTQSSGDELGIDWSLIYEDLSNSYNIGLASGFSASPEAASGSINILDGSRLNGSSLIVKALAKQGSVSVLTEPSVTTLNMESVPIQIAKQNGFLASAQVSQTANVGSTSALTPGTVTTGFNMTVMPYILPDNETILLSYSINLSNLDSIRRVESSGSAIEIPNVSTGIFSQKVRIKSGQTLVLSGFEQVSDNIDRNGVGSPRFWGLGGGSSHSKKRDVLVVLITPRVLR